jgi:vancomycin resistance protein YoaR
MQSTFPNSRYPMRPAPLRAREHSRIARTPADFALIFFGITLLAIIGLFFGWQFWHTNRIYGGVTIAGVPVGGLTRAAAMERVNESLLRYPMPPIIVEHGGRQWPVTGDSLHVSVDLLDAVNRSYLLGRQGSWRVRVNEQLMAILGNARVEPLHTVDPHELRGAVEQIAGDVRRAPRPFGRVGDITVAAQAGIEVNVDATVQALLQAFDAPQAQDSTHQSIVATLQTTAIAPPSEVVNGTPDTVPVMEFLFRPLVLRDNQYGLEFALDPATLEVVVLSQEPLQLDHARLQSVIEAWAQQIDIAPRDARLRFDRNSGSVSIVQTSLPGRRLEIGATLQAIEEALAQGKNSAPLVVNKVPPVVDHNRIPEMGIRELVAAGTTYFAGSSAARVRNIEVAAEKFTGVVIPPNGIFSFNKLIEDVSAANGFEDSLIIWGDRTAIGIGGGVCQVSTTIFRAAYNAGLPIVERYNHGYIVDWYGEPGLDATIFTPTVDFRFRNDTGAYLLIEPVVNAGAGTMTFNLYGTKSERQVTVGKPVISNVKPPPEAVYTVDPTLAPGQRKQVEWAKEGMDVVVTRTIVENGQTRTDTITSRYQPWRAVYLVGPGTDTPQSQTAATTAPAESAAEASAGEAPPAVEAAPESSSEEPSGDSP